MVLKNKVFCEDDSMCGEGEYCNTNTNYCRMKISCTDNQVCGEGKICKKEQDEENGYCVPDEISWNIGNKNWKKGISKNPEAWADYRQYSDSLPEWKKWENPPEAWWNERRSKRSDIAQELAWKQANEEIIKAEEERIKAKEERIKAEEDALEYAVNYPNWARFMPLTSETVNSYISPQYASLFPSARAKEIEKDRRKSRQPQPKQDPFAGVSSVSPTMSWGGNLKQNKKKRKITKRKLTKRKLTKRNKTKRNKTKRNKTKRKINK